MRFLRLLRSFRFDICKLNKNTPTMNEHFKIKTKNNIYEGFEKEKENLWKGPFCFVQSSDTQFGMIENYLEKKPNPQWDKEIELTQKAINAANKMNPRPKFFIVCGDLIDAFPNTSLRAPQERDFKKTFSTLNSEIPLICVCGNHDIGNTPTIESIMQYRSSFGDDHFVFWCGGVMCIVLNSQYYEDSSQVKDLAAEHEKWLDQQLAEAKSGNYKHIIVFQHIPWFLNSPEEEDEYFNINFDIRIKMLEKFKYAGVKIIFCGHYHRNAGGFYKGMELVVTSAIGAQLGKDKSGMRIVRVFDEDIKHDYYSLDELPQKIVLN